MDSHAAHERRRHVRIPIKVEVHLHLLLPEVTFTPHSFPAIAMDLSMSGMKLVSGHCPDDLYPMLLKTIRHTKIDCTLPGNDKSMEFRGRIVWVSLDNQTTPPHLNLGVSFEELSAEQNQALARCADAVQKSLVTSSAITPAIPITRPPKSS